MKEQPLPSPPLQAGEGARAWIATRGNPLRGELTLRGVTRSQRLEVLPSACARPGLDCGIQVNGSIDRSDFDMRQWQVALADKVWLLASLQLRGPVE